MLEDDAVKREDRMLEYLTMKNSEWTEMCKSKWYGQEQVGTFVMTTHLRELQETCVRIYRRDQFDYIYTQFHPL